MRGFGCGRCTSRSKWQLETEPGITDEHVRNNRDVRRLLRDHGFTPELLPASEDVKRVDRRLTSERKKLPKPE